MSLSLNALDKLAATHHKNRLNKGRHSREPHGQSNTTHNDEEPPLSTTELEDFADFSQVSITDARRAVYTRDDGAKGKTYQLSASIAHLQFSMMFDVGEISGHTAETTTVSNLQIKMDAESESELGPVLLRCESDCDIDGFISVLVNYTAEIATRKKVYEKLQTELCGGDVMIRIEDTCLLFGHKKGVVCGVHWDVMITADEQVNSLLQLSVKSSQQWSDSHDVLARLPVIFSQLIKIHGPTITVNSVVRTVCASRDNNDSVTDQSR